MRYMDTLERIVILRESRARSYSSLVRQICESNDTPQQFTSQQRWKATKQRITQQIKDIKKIDPLIFSQLDTVAQFGIELVNKIHQYESIPSLVRRRAASLKTHGLNFVNRAHTDFDRASQISQVEEDEFSPYTLSNERNVVDLSESLTGERGAVIALGSVQPLEFTAMLPGTTRVFAVELNTITSTNTRVFPEVASRLEVLLGRFPSPEDVRNFFVLKSTSLMHKILTLPISGLHTFSEEEIRRVFENIDELAVDRAYRSHKSWLYHLPRIVNLYKKGNFHIINADITSNDVKVFIQQVLETYGDSVSTVYLSNAMESIKKPETLALIANLQGLPHTQNMQIIQTVPAGLLKPANRTYLARSDSPGAEDPWAYVIQDLQTFTDDPYNRRPAFITETAYPGIYNSSSRK